MKLLSSKQNRGPKSKKLQTVKRICLHVCANISLASSIAFENRRLEVLLDSGARHHTLSSH